MRAEAIYWQSDRRACHAPHASSTLYAYGLSVCTFSPLSFLSFREKFGRDATCERSLATPLPMVPICQPTRSDGCAPSLDGSTPSQLTHGSASTHSSGRPYSSRLFQPRRRRIHSTLCPSLSFSWPFCRRAGAELGKQRIRWGQAPSRYARPSLLFLLCEMERPNPKAIYIRI